MARKRANWQRLMPCTADAQSALSRVRTGNSAPSPGRVPKSPKARKGPLTNNASPGRCRFPHRSGVRRRASALGAKPCRNFEGKPYVRKHIAAPRRPFLICAKNKSISREPTSRIEAILKYPFRQNSMAVSKNRLRERAEGAPPH